jgi:hypothetical protein
MHSNLHTGGILADDGAAVRGRRRVPAGRGKIRRSDDAPHCRIVIMPAGSCVVVALRPWWREAKLTVNSPFRLSDRMGAPCRGDRMRVCSCRCHASITVASPFPLLRHAGAGLPPVRGAEDPRRGAGGRGSEKRCGDAAVALPDCPGIAGLRFQGGTLACALPEGLRWSAPPGFMCPGAGGRS